MRLRLGSSVSLVVGILLAAAPPVRGQESPKFLPEGALRIMGARYQPADRDFQWDTSVGGEIGLFRLARTTLLIDVDVETILGNEFRPFDANQANYFLEGALRRRWGRRTVELFFSHVSRHLEDRPKPQTVDWNILGLRVAGPLALARLPTRFLISAGPTTRSSLVEYRFEGVGRLEVDLVTKPWGSLYLSGLVRGVKTKKTDALPRRGFVDARVEGGAHFGQRRRSMALFAAYERRNDVYPLVAEGRTRGLFGFRIGITDRPE